MILVTPKQEVERKSEWFCGVKIFRSKFKVEWENGVWTKICFLASGFLFTCGNFTLFFTGFFNFLDRIFCLNGFHNPFIVRSRSSFLFSQWKFFELYVRTCPAMFFLFRRHDFCYDHMTSKPLFVHSFMQFQLNCMCGVIFRSYWSEFFCSCSWLNFWSHLIYLTLKNDFLNLKLNFICFNSKR